MKGGENMKMDAFTEEEKACMRKINAAYMKEWRKKNPEKEARYKVNYWKRRLAREMKEGE